MPPPPLWKFLDVPLFDAFPNCSSYLVREHSTPLVSTDIQYLIIGFVYCQVRETRKAVRDSERQMEKMAIGHHINDRGHVITRSRNTGTGEQEETQDLYNIDDSKFVLIISWIMDCKERTNGVPFDI